MERDELLRDIAEAERQLSEIYDHLVHQQDLVTRLTSTSPESTALHRALLLAKALNASRTMPVAKLTRLKTKLHDQD